MKKQILGFLSLLVLVVTFVIPASASEVQPRREPCPECHTGFVREYYVVLDTKSGMRRPCQCTPPDYNAEDIAYKEYRQDHYECTNCKWENVGNPYWTPDWMLKHYG